MRSPGHAISIGELVEAYLARRALDYLVGFTLSPVLWRKLPGSRSAGRVQSVALRLICERESEIENFRSREYWTVEGVFRKHSGETLTAALTHLDGRKLDKFDLADETAALTAVRAAEARAYAVDSVERKQTRRNPAPPFVTSTLQQEASRKLGFSASHTMRVAQRLYEGVAINGETVGLITYMRTDGVQMSSEAITACRTLIDGEFGHRYLPEKPRFYKTKGEERAGGARGDPPDRRASQARRCRRLPRQRPTATVLADLEAHAGEPDGIGGARPGRRRYRLRGP